MEDLVRDGLVKSIGLSNFNHKQIQRVIDNSEIKPAMLQVRRRTVCFYVTMVFRKKGWNFTREYFMEEILNMFLLILIKTHLKQAIVLGMLFILLVSVIKDNYKKWLTFRLPGMLIE